ncbi:MAG: 50S ribosomal protein L30e [archaeon]
MAKVDSAKEIRRSVDTGKVIFGTKETEQSIKNGSAKLIIITNNAPRLSKEKLASFAEMAKIMVFDFAGTGLELGSICGKPFTVSAMAILDPGKSKVLEISK